MGGTPSVEVFIWNVSNSRPQGHAALRLRTVKRSIYWSYSERNVFGKLDAYVFQSYKEEVNYVGPASAVYSIKVQAKEAKKLKQSLEEMIKAHTEGELQYRRTICDSSTTLVRALRESGLEEFQDIATIQGELLFVGHLVGEDKVNCDTNPALIQETLRSLGTFKETIKENP